MPIVIPGDLPAVEILRKEHIFVMKAHEAVHQDIRPLEIVILNLMPEKETTETQLLRLLSNTPLQIHLTLIKTASYESKNASPEHLKSFYQTFDKIKDKKFDGMIITGAPVEHLDFNDVTYWNELKEIMDYSMTHITSTLHLCWGASAALYHHHGIRKFKIRRKLFGIFEHVKLSDTHPLLRGFDDYFMMPHSRYAIVRKKDVINNPDLELLVESEEAGICILSSKTYKQIFILGHPEYSQETLFGEYYRDLTQDSSAQIPYNYFKEDNPLNGVLMSWKAHGHLLFSNWINYCVYQRTPYHL